MVTNLAESYLDSQDTDQADRKIGEMIALLITNSGARPALHQMKLVLEMLENPAEVLARGTLDEQMTQLAQAVQVLQATLRKS